MGYDYAAYKKQYDSNAQKYKTTEGLDEDEYLSRMKKTDKFIPVITVVVYYGEKEWDGATNTKLDYNSLAKGDGRMCTVFDEIARESEVKGRAFGIIETGLEFGLSESDILSRLQKKLDVSLQVAQEYLAMFDKQTV